MSAFIRKTKPSSSHVGIQTVLRPVATKKNLPARVSAHQGRPRPLPNPWEADDLFLKAHGPGPKLKNWSFGALKGYCSEVVARQKKYEQHLSKWYIYHEPGFFVPPHYNPFVPLSNQPPSMAEKCYWSFMVGGFACMGVLAYLEKRAEAAESVDGSAADAPAHALLSEPELGQATADFDAQVELMLHP
jgi:hypothetical protein